MNAKEVGETIKNRRKELNIIQPHLAELAGISVNTLYKIERGQNNPTFDVLVKILEVLGLELKIETRKT